MHGDNVNHTPNPESAGWSPDPALKQDPTCQMRYLEPMCPSPSPLSHLVLAIIDSLEDFFQ